MTVTATTSTPAPKTVVPSITQAVKTDPGSAITSLIEIIRKAAIDPAVDMVQHDALVYVPFGALIEEHFGPHLASQYLDVAIQRGEAMAAEMANSIFSNPDTIMKSATVAFTTAEGWLQELNLGHLVPSWLKAAAAKIGFGGSTASA